MARVTVEDCVLKIPNRFDLVMLAAQRARNVSSGASITIDRDNDKNPVVALREIAEETIALEELGESLVRGLQKQVETDEPEEDQTEFDMAGLAGAVAESLEGNAATATTTASVDAALREALAQEASSEAASAEATAEENAEIKPEAVDPGALMGGGFEDVADDGS